MLFLISLFNAHFPKSCVRDTSNRIALTVVRRIMI